MGDGVTVGDTNKLDARLVPPTPLPGSFGEFIEHRDEAVAELTRIDKSLLRPLKAAPFVFAFVVLAFWLGSCVQAIAEGEGSAASWVGIVLATAGLVGGGILWRRVRRNWTPARRALDAWYFALRTPAVLALPTGHPNRDSAHAYRVRESDEFDAITARAEADAYALSSGDGRTVLRIVPYTIVFGFSLVLVAAGVSGGDWALAAGATVIVAAVLSATVRGMRRVWNTNRLWADLRDDRTRWNAWRVWALGAPGVFESWTTTKRAIPYGVAVIVGAYLIPWLLDAPVIGLAVTVVIVLPAAVLFVRHAAKRWFLRTAAGKLGTPGGPGADAPISVRFIEDDTIFPPATGHPLHEAATNRGVGIIWLDDDSLVVRSTAGIAQVAAADVLGIASSVPRPVATRKFWLMLADGNQLVFESGHHRRVRKLAATLQIRTAAMSRGAGS